MSDRHRPLLSRREPLSSHETSDRISAYVYGNILVLTSLVVLSGHDVDNGSGALIVAGTGASTFVAHVFAETLGAQAGESLHDRQSWWALVRGSVPILSATLVPVLILLAGQQGWIGETATLRSAEAWAVVRIALTSFFLTRLQGRSVSLTTWLTSFALAAVGTGVVALKILLTH